MFTLSDYNVRAKSSCVYTTYDPIYTSTKLRPRRGALNSESSSLRE